MDNDEDVRRSDTPSVVATLVSNHRAFLAFLERRLDDKAVAEDILQDAFSRGLDKVATIREDEAAIGWFYRVLKNAVVDYHRRKGASSQALARFANEIEVETPPEAVRNAICACVSALADNLKPEYAAALKRIEVDGVSVKDFARETGISGSNAAVRVFRAREALRKQVIRSCGTCADHGCLDCHCKT